MACHTHNHDSESISDTHGDQPQRLMFQPALTSKLYWARLKATAVKELCASSSDMLKDIGIHVIIINTMVYYGKSVAHLRRLRFRNIFETNQPPKPSTMNWKEKSCDPWARKKMSKGKLYDEIGKQFKQTGWGTVSEPHSQSRWPRPGHRHRCGVATLEFLM